MQKSFKRKQCVHCTRVLDWLQHEDSIKDIGSYNDVLTYTVLRYKKGGTINSTVPSQFTHTEQNKKESHQPF